MPFTARLPIVLTTLALLLSLGPALHAAEAVAPPAADTAATATWQAGVARTVITPEKYMWMSGYGGRSKPAEGKVHDLWFNRAEFFLRYFEVSIDGAEGRRLIPSFFAEALPRDSAVRATTLIARDLRRAPIRADDSCITMREEDRLNGFFAGGLRFSTGHGQIHDPA